MKPSKKITIDILGHKATILTIDFHAKDNITYRNDVISIWLDLEEPIGGSDGFGIYIPAMDYNKDSFLSIVTEEGKARLQEIINERAREKVEKEKKDKREKELEVSLTRIIEQL